MQQNWINKILSFWFEELKPEQWFSGSEALDQATRSRFSDLYEQLVQSLPNEVKTDSKSALAAILLFDQFPRNMFRKTAQAFATDGLALQIAKDSIASKLDAELTPEQRMFLYMPFQHSENLDDQHESVQLFERLGMEVPLKFAIEHLEIIQNFGRFPHRNNVMGRQSSAEEIEYMKTHGGFGQ